MEKDELTSHVTTLLLRLPIGLLFLLAGIHKFHDLNKFADAIHGQFDATFLGGPLLSAFITMLPFVEVVLGVLLVLGLFTRAALIGAATTLIVLFFGLAEVGKGDVCAYNMIYIFVTVLALRTCDQNYFSIDQLVQSQR